MSNINTHEELNGALSQKIKHVSRLIDSIIEEFYKPYSVTVAQSDVMNRIHSEGKLSMNALCLELNMSKSNLSPICKKLEIAGMLKKTRDFYDQRVVYLELTEKGEEVIKEANAAFNDKGLAMDKFLDAEKIETLTSILSSLEASLEKANEELK
ncbi:MAG: winged helix-turn-helix transcriptional regulator [Anaerofustis stercorihominis]|nr:winged helix-turn-helix transcriptional regulator [Anaerofustis stercorihominis]